MRGNKYVIVFILTLLILPFQNCGEGYDSVIALDAESYGSQLGQQNEPPVISVQYQTSYQLPLSSINIGATIVDGDGEIDSIMWEVLSGPNSPTLFGDQTEVVTISNLVGGIYEIRVSALDDDDAIGESTITITVYPEPLVGNNTPPIVSAGTDISVTLPTNSAAVVAMASDIDGTIASYSWVQLSGPSVATLTGATTDSLTTSGMVEGTYVFEVTVSDNDGAMVSDSISIQVLPAPPPPTFTFSQIQQQIYPSCVNCHGNGAALGNYSMSTYGSTVSKVVPGNAATSVLYQELDTGQMPPTGRLPQAQIDLVRDWINDGAQQ